MANHRPYSSNSVKRAAFRRELFEAQGGRCHLGAGCYLPGKPMTLEAKGLGHPGRYFATFDHLVSVKAGGKRHHSNFALAHHYCNSKRGHKDLLLC